MSVIEVKNLSVYYDQIQALENVSFAIEDKEFIGIIGPNGGGKTTLVKALLGLVHLSSGELKISKEAVIGYVPQFTTFDKQFPITVREVILTGHLPKKFKILHRFKGHEYDHAQEVMKSLGINHLANRQVGALSGGQLQRVLIARALMNHPTILILDEPTASVDEKTKEEIYEMLKTLNQSVTIIMITHDTTLMWPYLDRCIYIHKTAHLHNYVGEDGRGPGTNENCPIEWYIEGEKIHKALELSKERHND